MTDTIEQDDNEGQIIKRSVLLSGHRTSISLERIFWDELVRIVAARGLSINQMVSEIDRTRAGNLSSALRVAVLKAMQSERR